MKVIKINLEGHKGNDKYCVVVRAKGKFYKHQSSEYYNTEKEAVEKMLMAQAWEIYNIKLEKIKDELIKNHGWCDDIHADKYIGDILA